MDFQNVRESAQNWTYSDKTNFQLVLVDETERRITFRHREVSFYVVCPSNAEDTWQVWSDAEETLPYLHDVMEFLDVGKKRSLTEVLQKVNTLLEPLLRRTVAIVTADIGDDDDDDDDDDEDDMDVDDVDDDLQEIIEGHRAESSEKEEEHNYTTGTASGVSILRLLRDLKQLKKDEGKFMVVGNPRGNDLFVWDVQLIDLPTDTPLGKDLQSYSKRYKKEPVIEMEMTFPINYPMEPPFVRIIRPRFKFLTGHVTIGGSICMEMLTRSGWTPTNDIEGVLVQIRAEILSDSNARLDSNPDRAYDEYEARQAFDRMVQKYGWR